jgi:hypothetical protein
MDKALFARHALIRSAETELRKKATTDISFFLKYKRPECAELFVTLDFEKGGFTLYGLNLSFCLRCGRFIGFGSRYEICWLCEDELE